MWSYTVADPAEGPGGRGAVAPLIFGRNWGPKDQKNFFGRPPSPLSKGLDDRAPPYLKVWIWHSYTHQPQFAKHLLLNGGG